MSDLSSIAAVQAPALLPLLAPAPGVTAAGGPDFGHWLAQGLQQASGSIAQADATLRAVALGEPVAPHQALLAMEQARMELQLVLQVRNRLLEGVQELMRMQL